MKLRRWNENYRIQRKDVMCGNVVETIPQELQRASGGERPVQLLADSLGHPKSSMATDAVALKPDMQALRDICAGKTNRLTYEETVAAVGLPENAEEIPICGRIWWEEGDHWECLMDAGHKSPKHGQNGMVRRIDE
jgi:hypothetical protein